jgi:hypothetical protein
MATTGGEGGFFVGVASVLVLTFVGVLILRRHIPAGAGAVPEARRINRSTSDALD